MTKSPSSDADSVPAASPSVSASSRNQLTVLVFKDNSTARTFQVPLRWITQIGWILGAIVLTSILCIGIATRLALTRPKASSGTDIFQTSSASGDAQRIRDLENELKDAQNKIQTLSASAAPNTSASQVPMDEPPMINPALLSASSAISAKPFLFKGLPDQVQPPPTDATQVPIKLTSPQARWEGKTLKVRFNLQYVSSTPGGQQGRILIFARGPGAFLTHPDQVLQGVGKDILIDPNHGEYFSVSRFRETKADFGPLASHDMIKEVEVVILSSSAQILIHQKIIPGEVGQKAAAPETPEEKPSE